MTAVVYDGAGIVEQLVGLTATQTLTNKTLTTPVIGQINDANGNEALVLPAAAAAVNYPLLLNSATGADVELKALGDDAAIDISLRPKGTGQVNLQSALNANSNAIISPALQTVPSIYGTADILHVYNTVTPSTAQVLRIYNYRTDASNWEALAVDWATTANTCTIIPTGAGTGSTSRTLALESGGTLKLSRTGQGVLTFDTGTNVRCSAHWKCGTDQGFDLGATANRWNAAYLTTVELGHATDTTISRSAAGQISVEGKVVPTVVTMPTLSTDSGVTGQIAVSADEFAFYNGSAWRFVTGEERV